MLMNVVKNILELPDDIIKIIFEFIPRNIIAFLNVHYYQLYHSYTRHNIKLYEKYVRDMIKKDYYFVFQHIMRENIDDWIINRNYRYKNMIFNNYIYFIQLYCNEHNSEKCRQILMTEFQKRDLCRNQHKKNVVKYIKWNI